MRTIKFRGKRLDGQGWVYGDLLHDRGLGGDVISDVVWIRTANNQSYQVLPESVGQWTGLVDRHGKEIYEGDVLRAISNVKEDIGAVEYDVSEAQWFGAKDFLGYAVAYSGAEIIGNIHDNPELMEV